MQTHLKAACKHLQAAYLLFKHIALFAVATEKQTHAQAHHHRTRKALLPQQPTWVRAQTLAYLARSQSNAAQRHDARELLQAAQYQQLRPHRPSLRIDKLWDKRKHKQQRFGIGQAVDCAFFHRLRAADGRSRGNRRVACSACIQHFRAQIQQIHRACPLQELQGKWVAV